MRRICLLVLAMATGLAFGQTTTPNAPSDPASELKALREMMAQQQQQIRQQQQQIKSMQDALNNDAAAGHVEDAALHTSANEVNAAISDVQDEKPKESPLSFRIGGAEFTPGG